MVGLAIVLDALKRNPSYSFGVNKALNSNAIFSASLAAATATAASYPFAATPFFRFPGRSIVHCDAGVELTEDDYISSIRSASANILQHGSLDYSTKEYYIEQKPLFSAFQLRSMALTTVRSFLMFYLPLLEPRTNTEEDDEDYVLEAPERQPVDLIVPLKKSLKQIARETTVSTTRRGLERLAVHYFSQRMAWKLLKDVPKSAMRKADKGMPTAVYFFSVTRTTFRGHLLGVAASWLVQVGIDTYRFLTRRFKVETDSADDRTAEAKILGKRIYGITIRCSASLVFASIGAGIGATIFKPSTGQWIGCALGDVAGPVILSFCLEKSFHGAAALE